MRSLSFLAVHCICGFFLTGIAIAESIPVVNTSFEDPGNAGAGIGLHPGWTRSVLSGDVGIWQPGGSDFENIPDGTQVAYVKFGDGYLAQTLTAEVTAGIRYELSAFVGRYRGASAPGYAVQLFAGDDLLAQSTSPIPESSQWVESTAVFTATEGNPQIGTNLEIRLLSTDPRGEFNWAHFDDVRLNAITLSLSADCNQDGLVDFSDANCTAVGELEDFLASIGSLVGDIDGDGTVDFPDFLTLADNFGASGSYTDGDLNANGDVDFPDFLILANNFGRSWPVAAAVPEPSSTLLGLLSLVGLMAGRKRMV